VRDCLLFERGPEFCGEPSKSRVVEKLDAKSSERVGRKEVKVRLKPESPTEE
jgi:hypothetical protein